MGVIGFALVRGLGVQLPSMAEQATLAVFNVPPPPKPPPPEPPKPAPKANPRPEGAAAPPNLRAKPTEVEAPKPIVPIKPPPPPVVTAPTPGPGADSHAGNADIPGPGSGAGGEGNGTGSGLGGDGDGGGGTPPRQIAGRLGYSDIPQSVLDSGSRGGTVSVAFTVEPNGRVTDCGITHSSGNPALDDMTCRLIEKRFRFRPSRNAQGRPRAVTVVENHTWVIEDAPPPRPR
ncbi:hypothetical protein GCM10023219_11700 [Stakelama sediminis]